MMTKDIHYCLNWETLKVTLARSCDPLLTRKQRVLRFWQQPNWPYGLRILCVIGTVLRSGYPHLCWRDVLLSYTCTGLNLCFPCCPKVLLLKNIGAKACLVIKILHELPFSLSSHATLNSHELPTVMRKIQPTHRKRWATARTKSHEYRYDFFNTCRITWR